MPKRLAFSLAGLCSAQLAQGRSSPACARSPSARMALGWTPAKITWRSVATCPAPKRARATVRPCGSFSADPTARRLQIRVSTRRANGLLLDTLAEPELTKAALPRGQRRERARVGRPRPLRLTPDRLDRDYPLARDRSLEAELGGQLSVEAAGQPLASWAVGAPHSAAFAGIERLSVKLRVRVLRVAAGGAPSIGGDSGTALSIVRSEIQAASQALGAMRDRSAGARGSGHSSGRSAADSTRGDRL